MSQNDDLISRQAAIEAMEDVDWYHIGKDGQLVHGANSKEDEPLYKAEDVYKVLEQLPSAQPEIIHCKECTDYTGIRLCFWNYKVYGVWDSMIDKVTKFCRRCGQKIKWEGEE